VEVGFESPAHFTREFKRRFGVSPSRSLALLA
jgi:AraC-like DNA-binding protein